MSGPAAAGIVDRLKRTESPLGRMLLLRVAALGHAASSGHVVRRRRVAAYLAAHPDPCLHLGAGPQRLDGWLDTDLIGAAVHLDVGRRMPLPSATFAHAFAEHVIEHLSPRAFDGLLGELQRVLRPGGVVRITTPDLRKLIALYEDRNAAIERSAYAAYLTELTGHSYEQPGRLFNDFMRLWGHRYVFDEEDLRARLAAAGFGRVTRQEAGRSEHRALQGIERHGRLPWVNDVEAMCLEATKPA